MFFNSWQLFPWFDFMCFFYFIWFGFSFLSVCSVGRWLSKLAQIMLAIYWTHIDARGKVAHTIAGNTWKASFFERCLGPALTTLWPHHQSGMPQKEVRFSMIFRSLMEEAKTFEGQAPMWQDLETLLFHKGGSNRCVVAVTRHNLLSPSHRRGIT